MRNLMKWLWKVTLNLLIRLNQREIVILFTVIAGMLFSWFVFRGNIELQIKEYNIYLLSQFIINHKNEINELFDIQIKPEWVYYYTKYTISFIRSFLVLLFCVLAVQYTNSKRLKILLLFLLLSMNMDLFSIMSADFYRLIKPCRYTNYFNFKDFYTVFEVLCALYIFTNWACNFIKATIDNYLNRHDAICNSLSMESFFPQKKKTQRR